MDPLAHGTISAILIAKKTGWNKSLGAWVFFGVLPDIYGIVTFGLAALGWRVVILDKWFLFQYNLTHSLLIFATILLLISLWGRAVYWPFMMYGAHIVTDIFSHKIVETPILWPLSDFTIAGWFEYSEMTPLVVTYAIIIPIWAFIFLSRKISLHD